MKGIILLAFVLNIVVLSTQISMKIYDEPGVYSLSPFDYGYQDSVIIQMYSAGSGSTTTYYKNNTVIYCPGTSGSYVHFKLNTEMRTYYFSLGMGGLCSTINSNLDTHMSHNFVGEYGGDSTFYSHEELTIFNLEGAHSYIPTNNVIYIEEEDDDYEYYSTAYYEIINYHSGISDSCYYDGYPSVRCGSHAPYGYECISELECDGYFGSGANYGCNIYNNKYHQGGDGTLILYY